MRTSATFRAGLLAGIATTVVASAGAAWAQAKTFDVPAQGAASGVAAFARQADVQLLISAADAAGRRTNAVRGAYPVAQGLGLLLAGTGLSAQPTGASTWTVVRDPQPGLAAAPSADPADTEVSQLVVTGSLIRGAPPVGAHLTVLSEKDLRQSGRATLQEVMQTVPQNFSGPTSEATPLTGQAGGTGSGFTFGTSLNLRGVGGDGTLTLLNGRRLAPSGYGDFVDVSIIPLSAISRVEVLADGASATYGSDALAGVVNVIFNKRFEGAQTLVRYGVADDLDERRFSQLLGASWSGGHVTAGYEYYKRGGLKDTDRSFTATSDLRPWGGRDSRLPYSVPGNITGPAIWVGAIPSGQNGLNLQPGDLLRGQTNLFDTHGRFWSLPAQELNSGFVSATQELGDRIELYGDLLASRRDARYMNAGASTILTVPASNYYRQHNGFGGTAPITIGYNLSADLGDIPSHHRADIVALDGGALVQLFGTWALDAYVSAGRSREKTDTLYQDIFRANNALTLALASSDPATAFNPFGDGGDNPASVIDSLTFPYTTKVRSRYAAATLKVDGDLFRLPAGPVKLAAGLEYRAEDFRYAYVIPYRTGAPSSLLREGDRHVFALFGELRVPIVGDDNAVPGIRRLDLSVSGRFDKYTDFGSTTNPKVGVSYEPFEGLQVHASYGTSFKAPRLYDLNTPMGVQFYPAAKSFGGPDPNGDGITELLLVNGGNPDLTAERGKAWTAGVRFAPEALPGFSLDLTYFRLGFTNRIAKLASILQPLQNPTPYLGSVYFLNPTQAQVDYYVSRAATVTNSLPPSINAPFEGIIISQVANVSVVKLDGIDLELAQRWSTRLGDFSAAAAFTYYMRYQSRFSPSAPAVTVVDVLGAPIDLKGRASLSWSRGDWFASVAANYQDDYVNDTFSPPRKIKGQTNFDLMARYTFPEQGGWLNGVSATISAVNVFDQAPPFADTGGYGFDAHNYSAVGRLVSLTLEKRW
jgi:iron complex outermembrane receptor protein